MIEVSVNQMFISVVKDLKSEGIAYSNVAKRIGVTANRMTGILSKRTKAKESELKVLGEKFPEYQAKISEQTDIVFDTVDIDSQELKEKLEELERLRAVADKLEKGNQELTEILKTLTDTHKMQVEGLTEQNKEQQETIKKLISMLDKAQEE